MYTLTSYCKVHALLMNVLYTGHISVHMHISYVLGYVLRDGAGGGSIGTHFPYPPGSTIIISSASGYMTCMFDLFYSFTPYQNNMTPLHVASHIGHHDVVQTLLGAGADVNIATSPVSDMVLCSYTRTCTH